MERETNADTQVWDEAMIPNTTCKTIKETDFGEKNQQLKCDYVEYHASVSMQANQNSLIMETEDKMYTSTLENC